MDEGLLYLVFVLFCGGCLYDESAFDPPAILSARCSGVGRHYARVTFMYLAAFIAMQRSFNNA